MFSHHRINIEIVPPPDPRDYADFMWLRRNLHVDIQLLRAIRAVLYRVHLGMAIEWLRRGTLLPLCALNLGIAAWSFGSLLAPHIVAGPPPMVLAWSAILGMVAWSGFSAWWNAHGLERLLGMAE